MSLSLLVQLFLWLRRVVRGSLCVSAPRSLCFLLTSNCLPFFLPICLIVFSVSSFPLIILNREKLKHILDYLLYFVWCYCALTSKKLYRYFNTHLQFDRCCDFVVNYWQIRNHSLSPLLLGEFHVLSTVFCHLLFYTSWRNFCICCS